MSNKDEKYLVNLRYNSERDKDAVRSCCAGSSEFWTLFSLWFLFTILFPIVVIIPIITQVLEPKDALGGIVILSITSCLLFCIGCCVCCNSIRKIVIGGVIKKPPIPEKVGPFKKKGKTIPLKKIVLIVNPYGGGGKAVKLTEEIALPILKEKGIEVELLKTQYAGHASEFAKTADISKFDAICIVGGDGSFHEVINGLLTREDGKKIPLGLLPGGSGNSFLVDINQKNTLSFAQCVENFTKGNAYWTDVNQVTMDDKDVVYSINVVGLALMGDTGVLAESYRWLGPKRYDYIGLWLALKSTMDSMKIEMDDEVVEGKFIAAFFNLTQHFGQQMRAAPKALLDDNRLDAVLVAQASRGDMFRMFVQVKDGLHVNDPLLVYRQPKTVTLTFKSKTALNIDGDVYTAKSKAQIQSKHKAFKFITTSTYEETV